MSLSLTLVTMGRGVTSLSSLGTISSVILVRPRPILLYSMLNPSPSRGLLLGMREDQVLRIPSS